MKDVKAGEGKAWSLAGAMVINALRFFAQIGGLMVLARLLVPEDFGVLGLAMAGMGFLILVQHAGLPTAIARSPTLPHGDIYALHRFAILWGIVMAGVAAVVMVGMGRFFDEPRLAATVPLWAAYFLASGLHAVPEGLIQRAGRVQTLMTIDLAAIALAQFAAVALALLGGGYLALFAMQPIIGLTRLALYRYRAGPIPRESGGSTKGKLGFGFALSGSELLRQALDAIPAWALGAAGQTASVGYFNRFRQIIKMGSQVALLPAYQAALAHLRHCGGDPLEKARLLARETRLTAGLLLPMGTFLIIEPKAFTHVLLGPQWLSATTALSWLALLLPVLPLASAVRWYWLAEGRGGRLLLFDLALMVGLGITFATAGAGLDLVASCQRLAILWLVFQFGLIVATALFAPALPGPLLRAHLWPALASSVAALVTMVWPWTLAALPVWAQSVGAGIVFAGVYLLVTACGWGIQRASHS